MSNSTQEPLPFALLIVDDDDVAVEGVMRSLRKHGDFRCQTIAAGDGQEALEILRGQHPDKSVNRPYLVLLDLNMPRMDGFEFLEAVRGDEALRQAVIFVLTTSSRDADRARAYEANIAGYMVKSAVGPQFSRLAQFLGRYADAVKLP